MMGAGINYHLSVNVMLREIFELGAPLHCDATTAYKPSKTERVTALLMNVYKQHKIRKRLG